MVADAGPYLVSVLLTLLLAAFVRRTTGTAEQADKNDKAIGALQTDLAGERRETSLQVGACLREIGHVRGDVAEIRKILLERPPA